MYHKELPSVTSKLPKPLPFGGPKHKLIFKFHLKNTINYLIFRFFCGFQQRYNNKRILNLNSTKWKNFVEPRNIQYKNNATTNANAIKKRKKFARETFDNTFFFTHLLRRKLATTGLKIRREYWVEGEQSKRKLGTGFAVKKEFFFENFLSVRKKCHQKLTHINQVYTTVAPVNSKNV